MSYGGLLKKLNNAPHHPDITHALEAYVAADKACDKAREMFEKAELLAAECRANLEAVIDRVTSAPRAGEKEN